MWIRIDDPTRAEAAALLREHLADMHATSPAESVHALAPEGLTGPDVTFWTASQGYAVVGCAALRELSPTEGELKAMRTSAAHRGQGVGAGLLRYVLAEARSRGYGRVSLETGAQDFFAPAHRLYAAHGFLPCGPFGDYREDPHSRFFTLDLSGHEAPAEHAGAPS